MKKRPLLIPVIILLLTSLSSAIVINEFVTDPQTDWDKNGNVSTSKDEFIELFNPENETIDMTNWTLLMNDTSPAIQYLNGSIRSGGYKIYLDPTGTMNNDGQILLFNPEGNLIDSITYGNLNDGNISDNAPTGNADSFSDECLARIPNGQDTNLDSADFIKTECTYNLENRVILPNEQNIEVTIVGGVTFYVLPRNLEFGLVSPGSSNNNATNGPIILNITGSMEDAQVEITEVLGTPFNQGLKIDGIQALGKLWRIYQEHPITTAVPTLDVPQQTQPGNKKGTIVYTVTGIPPQ